MPPPVAGATPATTDVWVVMPLLIPLAPPAVAAGAPAAQAGTATGETARDDPAPVTPAHTAS